MSNILVTGGAGYVGSHTVKQLLSEGHTVVILDNLVCGHREFAQGAKLVASDIGDAQLLKELFSQNRFSAVMHFSAYAYVGESVTNPTKYYQNNVAATLTLLGAMLEAGVHQFIFSSTCATYGNPLKTPITEEHPQNPINPYGATKLMAERILKDYERAYGLRSIIFRYFNAAGADPGAQIGEWHLPETHLIPLVLDVAAGKRASVDIYGTDYPTPDGTCIRDYIHVADIAQAHVLGLSQLESGSAGQAFNLGNGSGFSVREVIHAAERVTGKKISAVETDRREGDPPVLVGSSAKAIKQLGWQPHFPDLTSILATAWKWHQQLCRKS